MTRPKFICLFDDEVEATAIGPFDGYADAIAYRDSDVRCDAIRIVFIERPIYGWKRDLARQGKAERTLTTKANRG